MKNKLVPLWTARLTAEHRQSFEAHQGMAPAKPPTRFTMRQERITPPLPSKRKEEKYHSLRYVETANATHDKAQKGPIVTAKMLEGKNPMWPVRSTRTATAKNSNKGG